MQIYTPFSTQAGYHLANTNIIHDSFKFGKNLKIGAFCIIEEDVIVGDDVEIQNYVLLRKGTRIGSSCCIHSYFDSSKDII